jgi:ABC-type Fe3+-hydroxamate transport system substrate-binding protein
MTVSFVRLNEEELAALSPERLEQYRELAEAVAEATAAEEAVQDAQAVVTDLQQILAVAKAKAVELAAGAERVPFRASLNKDLLGRQS